MSFNFPGLIHFCTASLAGYTASKAAMRMNGFRKYARKTDTT